MTEPAPETRLDRLQLRLRQLILMRETGPKRPAWHAVRSSLIWRLHDEIAREQAQQAESHPPPEH